MNYKLIGQRVLRKYTAAKTSPTYAASVDANLVVDSLCYVPWEKVSARDATMTYHTEENVGTKENPIGGLDMNVVIRDQFDAALFCAGHVGGQHRAYANAAVYHYVLPDGALPKLTRLVANVTSDPYNSAGARIAILTNATGEIPTNCNACRTGDAHADGVAPRTVAANGNWFPTMADCVFSSNPAEGETALPSGGLQLQKHLFVFVLMESYSTVRGNWLEGCSFIRNLVSVETDAAVPGWTDGETVDTTAAAAMSFAIARQGIVPCVPAGKPTGVVTCSVRADANPIVNADDGSQPEMRDAEGAAAASALSRLFEEFYSERSSPEVAPSPGAAQIGASFNVVRSVEGHVADGSDEPVGTDILKIFSSVILFPFAWPESFSPSRIVLSFATPNMSVGARFNVFLASGYLTALGTDALKDCGLYSGDTALMSKLGEITGGTRAEFPVPPTLSRFSTVVISGYFPPDMYNLQAGGSQGTGHAPFIPDITITE